MMEPSDVNDNSGRMSAGTLLEPQRIRREIRARRITGTSRGLAHGFVQCNLAILPKAHAFDFLLYCQRNQRACPVLEVTDPGRPVPDQLAPDADLRTDCARYAVFRGGVRQDDRIDISDLWHEDLVAFLIGSGISLDGALERAGVPTHRHRWVLRTPADRTSRSVRRKHDRDHALAHRRAGDHRDADYRALSFQPRRSASSRRSGGDRS
jgi:uncharacterized protein YcsI (UPF0317 family)